ncbi:F0F1 ATP synthase subunit I [Arsenophonus endosymbiont of Aphis craccivora]|uniref:F0F1 ATP synthase subunit I n=1 Tax=Arsenophonus endosymbiont of Aphis craccivora TaxID=1231049 RepID=UPI0015DD3D2D|nr:F0F1 ATP synthase subunit I [Arsenophonus endosymbiont of Aphis craccivora]QLK87519.1 F0F1 ATP synthase subunit I [Arsenophonus endosymbiont of Aphis craccivora]
MSVSLYNGKIALKLLLFQLMELVVLSIAFYMNSVEWGLSAFAGGFACWLPNALFMLLIRYQKAVKKAVPINIAWFFTIGEGVKVIIAITVLVIALGIFKAAFVPLGLTYLAMLIIHIITPAVIR